MRRNADIDTGQPRYAIKQICPNRAENFAHDREKTSWKRKIFEYPDVPAIGERDNVFVVLLSFSVQGPFFK